MNLTKSTYLLKCFHFTKWPKAIRISLFLSLFCAVTITANSTIPSQEMGETHQSKKSEAKDESYLQATNNSETNTYLKSQAAIVSEKMVQQITISGKITDNSTGEPLPGVNILEKGTNNGSVSGLDGTYNIGVSDPNAILVFSFVGYIDEETAITGRTSIDMALDENIESLDEVVVIGYGTQRRSDITGSVTTVSKERLSKLPVSNLTHALEGSTAGLNITQTSSVPGSASTMQVRGVNSINAKTEPFIVLDGIPFFGSTNDINPNDIKSIEILKDASAVAIYGTRGSNGVILITTKNGEDTKGKPKISYNGYYGFENMAHVLTPMSPEQYVQKHADYNTINDLTQSTVLLNSSEVENYNNGTTTDWLDEATQGGNIQEHSISLSSGNKYVQYYISGNYLEQKGVVKGFQYKRTGIRSNIDAQITDYLKVGVFSFFTNNNYDGGRANFLEANAMSPYSVPYDENGDYIIYPMAPEQLFANPLLKLTSDRLQRERNLTGTGYAEITPKIIPGLKYRFNASYAYNLNRFAEYVGRKANDQSGTAKVNNAETTNWVIENIVNYNIDIDKHHLTFTGLYSAQKVDYIKTESKSKIFTNDALSYYKMSAGSSQSTDSEGNGYSLLSQMGRLNYSYDSRYLLTITARRDGYSAFGSSTNKYGLFPSVAIAWNVTNEGFMSALPSVSELKVRISHGTSGNQAIDPNLTASTASTVQYPFGGSVATGVLYKDLGNAKLNWEETTSTNLGIDFELLNKRISGTMEVYKSKTKDILLKRNLPKISGYDIVWANLGSMQNLGLDFNITTRNISRAEFSWQTSLNFSTYKNKVLELYGDGKDDIGNKWFIGEPLRVIYDYKKLGIWQEGEDIESSDPVSQPGDIKFWDKDGDGEITSDDKTIIGQQDPKWTGGITNTFGYKNFSFSIFIQTSQGGLRSNRDLTYADEAGRRNLPEDYKYWTPENKDNYWPSLAAHKNYRGYQFAEDYSYIRIKDITLSYQVPQKVLDKLKINQLTVYASGRNLYTFTDWFGWDPEMKYVSRGSEDWEKNYPSIRTISFGLNITL